MSLRASSEINLHFVWHVKNGDPVLRDEVETHAHRFIKGKARASRPRPDVRAVGTGRADGGKAR